MRRLQRGIPLAPWLLTALLALGVAAPLRAQAPPPRLRIGLALGGGGARGFAHIGVLHWLEEHRIPVDVVGGTSMGGLIGGAFATGMTADDIHALVGSVDWAAVLAPDTPFIYKTFRRKEDTRAFPSRLNFGLKGGLKLPNGLSPAQQVDLLFDRVSAPFASDVDFNALPTPFRCVATDLRKAEIVVFDSGWLASALRSTMAIPGVFSPVEIGNKVLVDGGVLNNVPADVVRGTGLADRVVAVDVGADLAIKKTSDSIFAVLGETLDVMMRAGTRRALESADLVLIPDLRGVQTSDFGRADELARKGYEAAAARAEALLPFALSEADYAAWAAARQARRPVSQLIPSRIIIDGAGPGESRQIARRLAPHVGRPLDSDQLDKDLLILTGSGRYESATYRLDDRRGQPELVVALERQEHGPPFLSLALDLQNTHSSSVAATVRGRVLMFDVAGRGSEGRIDFAIGNTLLASAELYRPLGRSGLFVAPRVFASRHDSPVFNDDEYVTEYRDSPVGAAIDVGVSTALRFESRLGYTVEHVSKDVRIGEPSLPNVNGRQRYVEALATYDGQTGPTIPDRGVYLKTNLRRFLEVPGVMTPVRTVQEDPDDLWSGQASLSWFHSIGRRGRLFMRGAGGSSFGDTAVVNAFTLGGPFDLGAFYANQLRGSNYVLANLGYFHEIGTLAEGALGRLYVGTWLDEGAAFEQLKTAAFQTNVSGGFVLESPIGPLFAGASVDFDGRYRIYFSLGPFLKR
jgi:NTE family protein